MVDMVNERSADAWVEDGWVSVTVFRNAVVFDGSAYRGQVGDVVVADGRIMAVGEDLAPIGASVVDVGGGLLLPGFTDAHVHPVQGGLERLSCDLSGLRADRGAYLAHIRDYAHAHLDLAWIQGGGWAMAAFPGGLPTAAELDEVVPDRPVALANRDHHGMWLNSRALEVAGITADTVDPPDGHVERDAQGRPTGALHEGAMGLLAHSLPVADDDQMHAAFLEGQRYLHSLGVTSWQDAIVGAYSGMRDPGPTYVRAAAAGDLTGTVVGALWWDRDRGSEQLADLVAKRQAWTGGRFAATAVKIMQDGVAENGTAALVTPRATPASRSCHRTSCAATSARSTRRDSRSTSTVWGTGVCARRSTRSRAPTLRVATTSHTSSSCTPTTSSASAGSGSRPTSRRSGPAATTR